jgi:hypothetical protein
MTVRYEYVLPSVIQQSISYGMSIALRLAVAARMVVAFVVMFWLSRHFAFKEIVI